MGGVRYIFHSCSLLYTCAVSIILMGRTGSEALNFSMFFICIFITHKARDTRLQKATRVPSLCKRLLLATKKFSAAKVSRNQSAYFFKIIDKHWRFCVASESLFYIKHLHNLRLKAPTVMHILRMTETEKKKKNDHKKYFVILY